MAQNSPAPFGASGRGEKGLWMTTVNGRPHAIAYAVATIVAEETETAAAGVGCFYGFGSPLNSAFPSDGDQTEERALWRAVVQGLLQVSDETSVRRVQLRMTSPLVVNIMKGSNLALLKQNGWRLPSGDPVKYGGPDGMIALAESTVAKFDSVDWVLLRDGPDPFRDEAERMAYKEAKHWRNYFRGYDKMFD